MLAKVRHTKTLKIEGTIDTVLNRSHDIELECLYYTSLSYLCTDAVFDASFHILLVFIVPIPNRRDVLIKPGKYNSIKRIYKCSKLPINYFIKDHHTGFDFIAFGCLQTQPWEN